MDISLQLTLYFFIILFRVDFSTEENYISIDMCVNC